MSTHAFIGKIQEDGSIQSIYCHFDGYPDHTGKTLVKHYGDEETQELINSGDIRSLEKVPSKCERTGDSKLSFKTFNGFYSGALEYGAEYIYLRKEGRWSCFNFDETEIVINDDQKTEV